MVIMTRVITIDFNFGTGKFGNWNWNYKKNNTIPFRPPPPKRKNLGPEKLGQIDSIAPALYTVFFSIRLPRYRVLYPVTLLA